MLTWYSRYLLAVLLPSTLVYADALPVAPQGSAVTESTCAGGNHDATITDPAVHKQWASSHGGEETREILVKNIDLIFKCSELSDSDFANFYADASVVMGQTEPNAWCFDGDKAAVESTRDQYREWALSNSRVEVREKLVSKASTIFKCLTREARVSFFPGISTVIADAFKTSEEARSARASLRNRSSVVSTLLTGTPTPMTRRLRGLESDNPEGERGFRVWLKTTACSESRYTWLSVAREDPSTESAKYDEAVVHFPFAVCSKGAHGCTLSEASVEADLLRSASEYSKYCCHNWSVWSNPLTGQRVMMKDGERIPGSEFSIPVSAGTCCEDAAADALLSPEKCAE